MSVVGETSVCVGGPWAGRVYGTLDLEARREAFAHTGHGEPFEYEPTGEFETVGKGKQQTEARVWRYRRRPRRERPVEPQSCLRRGCETPPDVELRLSIGGRPWFACGEHRASLQAAMLEGVPGATSGGAWVDIVPVPPTAARGAA